MNRSGWPLTACCPFDRARHAAEPRRFVTAALLGVVALLGACATPDPSAAYRQVDEITRPWVGQPLVVVRSETDLPAVAEQVNRLLAQPLTADAAVQLALMNHRGLQARLQAVGISQAELAQASRLPNPGLSFGRLTRGDEVEIERGLHVKLARLVAWPLVGPIEARRAESLRRDVAMDVLRHAADTRRAWVQAVAAEEALRYRLQVREAADAGAELARRMEQAGNFNRLMRAREQGFLAEAALGVARAEQQRLATRERLVRLLGLWGADAAALRLPERLPDLPAAAREQPDIERQALAQRLDVQAARLQAEQTARHLGLTRTTRFIDVLELGAVRNSSNEAPVQRGWEIALELPLFDWGGAKVARADAVYLQSVHRAADTAIQARSEVREAYGQYRLAWDIARHQRDELVPLARRISDEQLLRYNGMLIGVFELLADARSQVTAVTAALEALRDFWLAEADLQQAMTGRTALALPASAAPARSAAAVADPH